MLGNEMNLFEDQTFFLKGMFGLTTLPTVTSKFLFRLVWLSLKKILLNGDEFFR